LSRLALGLLGLALYACQMTALGQNAESAADRRVQDWLSAQSQQTELGDKRCKLGNADAGEIVVCRTRDADADRYPGRGSLASVQSTRDGLPRAPDLAPHYPGVVVARGCFIGPCAPPPMIFIDVKALPEAPAGSDADRIAKGDMPER